MAVLTLVIVESSREHVYNPFGAEDSIYCIDFMALARGTGTLPTPCHIRKHALDRVLYPSGLFMHGTDEVCLDH